MSERISDMNILDIDHIDLNNLKVGNIIPNKKVRFYIMSLVCDTYPGDYKRRNRHSFSELKCTHPGCPFQFRTVSRFLKKSTISVETFRRNNSTYTFDIINYINFTHNHSIDNAPTKCSSHLAKQKKSNYKTLLYQDFLLECLKQVPVMSFTEIYETFVLRFGHISKTEFHNSLSKAQKSLIDNDVDYISDFVEQYYYLSTLANSAFICFQNHTDLQLYFSFFMYKNIIPQMYTFNKTIYLDVKTSNSTPLFTLYTVSVGSPMNHFSVVAYSIVPGPLNVNMWGYILWLLKINGFSEQSVITNIHTPLSLLAPIIRDIYPNTKCDIDRFPSVSHKHDFYSSLPQSILTTTLSSLPKTIHSMSLQLLKQSISTNNYATIPYPSYEILLHDLQTSVTPECHITSTDKVYIIEQDHEHFYVDKLLYTCTCSDFKTTFICKHIAAVLHYDKNLNIDTVVNKNVKEYFCQKIILDAYTRPAVISTEQLDSPVLSTFCNYAVKCKKPEEQTYHNMFSGKVYVSYNIPFLSSGTQRTQSMSQLSSSFSFPAVKTAPSISTSSSSMSFSGPIQVTPQNCVVTLPNSNQQYVYQYPSNENFMKTQNNTNTNAIQVPANMVQYYMTTPLCNVQQSNPSNVYYTLVQPNVKQTIR